MCGICGVVRADRSNAVPMEMLRSMAHTLRFRGPDGEGFWHADGVGLGHRRLSVIDLARGAQPMTDPSGKVTITFNGEIYNFADLRQQLQAAGDRFRTTSDTEVLLLGYLRWGQAVLDRLLGMFAFAIWDARSETLFVARDRFGVKPLYWARTPEGDLLFGSELSTILASGLIAPRLNRQALARYLILGYAVGPESILDQVRRLAPGTALTWRRGAEPQIRTYWDMAERWRAQSHSARALDPTEEFAALLETAVRDRLTSDVPLGALLSGGLDSTVITALMCRARPQVRSFSCGFAEAGFDELPWARTAAGALGTLHQDQVVRCDSPDLLLEIAARQDEPFADTSIVPTHALCRMARQHVTVALSGDGGDELLAGYITHRADAYRRKLARWPRFLIRGLRSLANLLPDRRRKVSFAFKARQFFAGAHRDAPDAHAWWRMLCTEEHALDLLQAGSRPSAVAVFEPFREAYRQGEGLSGLDRMLYVDYKTWLADDILVKVDRASMAYGLEVRSPFLDHRLWEFCASLPADWKWRHGRGKRLLREAARPLVPGSILRRRKSGFNAPVSHWIAGSWRDLVEEYLGRPRLEAHGILDAHSVRSLLSEHLAGHKDHGFLLFNLLQLSLWLDKVRPGLSLDAAPLPQAA